MGTNSILGGGGFHHVALKTKAWDRSLAFYGEVLGFTTKIIWSMPNGHRAGMFDVGDGNYLEIFEDPAYNPAPDGALLHLAIRTTDVDAATRRVRDAGMKVTIEPKDVTVVPTNGADPVSVRLAFFVGPNGEVWELFQNDRT
jgi:catechol 2,3-dioxygenase-like lactoylglutathione lyase family enzyme